MNAPFAEFPDRLLQGATLADLDELLNRQASRRAVLRVGGLLGAAALTPALWVQSARASSTSIYGKHLAYGTDPKTSMLVAFAVTGPFTSAAVRITNSDGVDFTVPAEVATVRGSNNRYARATVIGLKPDTLYHYAMTLDGTALATSTLRTAPSTAVPFRFTAFGDQGTGIEAREMVRRVGSLRPRLHLLAGDLCYADSSGGGRPQDVFHPRRWDEWLAVNGPVARSIPWMCAVGNHEMEPGFGPEGYSGVLARVPIGGTSPLAVPVASVFRVASTAFISLDSNDVSHEIPANRGWTNGAQTAWLESTLAALRTPGSGVDFIVAYMHHSAYCTNTSHGSEGGIREAWVPLFDRYTVDLVVSGHNHCYERTRPLRAGAITSHASDTIDSRLGTTYVTAGGGGQVATRNFTTNGNTSVSLADGRQVETAPWSVPDRTGEHLVLCVDVTPSSRTRSASMHLRALGAAGDVRDQIALVRGPVPASSAGLSAQDGWLLGAGGVVAGGLIGTGAIVLRRRATAPSTSESS
ncbi:MAG: metallophosphoesterase [Jatrophihabitantaceae bacterium]